MIAYHDPIESMQGIVGHQARNFRSIVTETVYFKLITPLTYNFTPAFNGIGFGTIVRFFISTGAEASENESRVCL
jgi:hypothetical protein